MSSISIINNDKKNLVLNSTEFVYHNKDKLFVLSNSDSAEITLIAPNQSKFFRKISNKLYNLNSVTPINNNYTSIKVKLYRNSIISIPRYWYFSFESETSFNIYYSDTIFTFILYFLQVIVAID